MPKKKTPVRNPWTKDDIRQLKAHSKTRTPVVEVEGDEANRGGGPAKGEDNRHRSWSSPLRTLTLIDSPKGSWSWSVDHRSALTNARKLTLGYVGRG